MINKIKKVEKISNQLLLFVNGAYQLSNPFVKEEMLILERFCYVKIMDSINTKAEEGYRRFLIRGNPGIGKTYFLYWLLVDLVCAGKVVVWNRLGFQSTIKCFNSPSGQSRRGSNLYDFEKELDDLNTYYLVDSVANPGEVSALTIMVASPRKKKTSNNLLPTQNYLIILCPRGVTVN